MINMQPKLISIETLKCKRNNIFLFGLLSVRKNPSVRFAVWEKMLLFGLLSKKKSFCLVCCLRKTFRLVCCFCKKPSVWFTVCAKIGVWLAVCTKIGVWLAVFAKIGTSDVDAGYEQYWATENWFLWI